MNLRETRKDQRRSLRALDELVDGVTLNRVTFHVEQDEAADLTIFFRLGVLHPRFITLLRVVWKMLPTVLVNDTTERLAAIVIDQVVLHDLQRQLQRSQFLNPLRHPPLKH